ncbi:hypothetical protein VTO73DRAFT_8991 [Trametes versicolor]
MMFIENLAVLSIAIAAAAFACVRALDTASGTSTLPIPTTVTSCIQQCFDQAELQSGCNGPNDTVPCLCSSAAYLHVALACLQAACPPDIESALQTYTEDCFLSPSASGSASIASTAIDASTTSVSPSPTSESKTDSSSNPGATATNSSTAQTSQPGGSSASATSPASATASEPLTGSLSAVSTSTHTHPSKRLLIALPLVLALAFIAGLALFWRWARRRHQQHAALIQPHSLPPPPLHSPTNTTSPTLKGGESPIVLAPPQVSVAPSVDAHYDNTPQYGNQSTGGDAQGDGGAEAGAQERVMVLPWSLGERVLALLAGRHGEASRNGSVVGTEALPPYEERDARM